MAVGVTSRYFQNYNRLEQNLVESLINESIRIYGIDCYYIARNFNNLDKVYAQDDQSSYTYAWLIAIYLKNVLGFAGDREFLSKFAGLEIRDQVIFSILAEAIELLPTSRSTFISASVSTTTRPPIFLALATHSGVTVCFDKRVNQSIGRRL